jgi:hypothetical protein
MRRVALTTALVLLSAHLFGAGPARASARLQSCAVGVGNGLSGSGGVLVNGVCVPAGDGDDGAGPVLPTRVVDCGRGRGNDGTGLDSWKVTLCGDFPIVCPGIAGEPFPDAFQTQIRNEGRWFPISAWCPSDGQPVTGAATLREQAVRLLPSVGIGATASKRALVNLEALYWADTAVARDLGTVALVGTDVELRAHFNSARWDFGDGSPTVATTEPGRAFTADQHCGTAQCAHFFGHTYTTSGPMTVSMTVSWQVQFRILGGPWQDVPGVVAGPTSSVEVRVSQAQAVLMPA